MRNKAEIIVFIHFSNYQDTAKYCNAYEDVAFGHVLMSNDFGEKFFGKCCSNSAKMYEKQVENGLSNKLNLLLFPRCSLLYGFPFYLLLLCFQSGNVSDPHTKNAVPVLALLPAFPPDVSTESQCFYLIAFL